MELIEDTIVRVVLRDAKKIVEEQKIAVKDDMIKVDKAEDEKADWVKIIDSEKDDMWWINEMESGKVKFVDAEKNDGINVDKEESGKTEVDEMKFPPYDKMNFNWKKVKALYLGQSK